jgi:tetraspanin-33
MEIVIEGLIVWKLMVYFMWSLQLIGGAFIGIGFYALVDQWQTGDGVRVNDIADILFNVGLIIAIIGAVIFFVSFAGCIGALRENTTLLQLVFLTVYLVLLFTPLSIATWMN